MGLHKCGRPVSFANRTDIAPRVIPVMATGLWPISDLRAYLTGRWTLARTIRDLRQVIGGTLEGTAEFTPADSGLLYCEEGILTLGSHRGPAEQQLCFAFPLSDARADVAFRDGRPFYQLDLSRGADAVTHVCDPDLYEGHFLALDADRWQSVWKVTGPRKDQELLSLYTRLV